MLSEIGFDNFVKLPLPHEQQLLEIFNKAQPLVIFDIGTCEGEDSIRYAHLFPKSHIHSFEPVASNYKIASENIKRYKLEGRITLSPVALSNEDGEAEFYLSSGAPTDIELQPDWDYGNKSSSLLRPKKTLEVVPWLKFEKSTKVKTLTFDNYCTKHSIEQVDLIHMDVQGAELMVLQGANSMLKNVTAIWLEVEAVELYKNQPLKRDVEKFMKRRGFVKYLDTVDTVAGDQLYVKAAILSRGSDKNKKISKERLKIFSQVQRLKDSLVTRGDLIKINPQNREFSLHIPSNQRWTFSENDYYEENVVYWLELLLVNLKKRKRELVFYDIGANCGYYSLLASKLVSGVYSFEPSRESFQILSMNARQNNAKNIILNQVAVTNKKGELTFYTYSSSGNDSLIRRNIPEGHELKYKTSYKVRAEKLDTYVAQKDLPMPDFIKMDIEGAELFALEGAKETLHKAHNPPLIIEYSEATSDDAGYSREKIRDLLIDLGYKVYGISDDNKTTKLIPITRRGISEKHVSNLVAVADNTSGLKLLES